MELARERGGGGGVRIVLNFETAICDVPCR